MVRVTCVPQSGPSSPPSMQAALLQYSARGRQLTWSAHKERPRCSVHSAMRLRGLLGAVALALGAAAPVTAAQIEHRDIDIPLSIPNQQLRQLTAVHLIGAIGAVGLTVTAELDEDARVVHALELVAATLHPRHEVRGQHEVTSMVCIFTLQPVFSSLSSGQSILPSHRKAAGMQKPSSQRQ